VTPLPRLVIAGTHSGVGKTTIATGLMALLARKGYRVQPFKAGPDYIDPGYHSLAAGRVSRNLDTWIMEENTVRLLFHRAAAGADLAVVEGVMGLFDGSRDGERGSTAHLARILEAPVVLIVDVRGSAASAAAMVLGYREYDHRARVAGVILNRVGSERQYRWAREIIEGRTGARVLGYLAREDSLTMPDRHLGLVPTVEGKGLRELLDRVVARLEQGIDLAGLLEVARSAPSLPWPQDQLFPPGPPARQVAIGVARDRAFQFYYQDSLELLQAYGAELVPFSALEDEGLPPGLDGLFLGGGFPELYAGVLQANLPLRRDIRRAVRAGMPVYAECGGMMYLSRELVDFEGRCFRMAGVVPGRVVMDRRLAGLGYREAVALTSNPLMEAGQVVRGHEFHWSRLEGAGSARHRALHLHREGEPPYYGGFVTGSLLASYLHLHFCSHPFLARNFVEACRRYRAATKA